MLGSGTKWTSQLQSTWPLKLILIGLCFSLKSKLIARSNCKLSLAGQILVANQVMLASLWYISTCWNPDPRMCHQLHEVVPNFIWKSNLEISRAKVWWDSLALLVSKELWGTKDPKAQAKSFFTKVWKHIRESKLLSYCIFFSISIFEFQVCHYYYFLITIFLHSDWSNTKKWNVKKTTF